MRFKNIENKSEEQLKAFSAANKVSKATKNESDFNYDSKYAFYRFYRDFEKFMRMVRILQTLKRLQKSQTHQQEFHLSF